MLNFMLNIFCYDKKKAKKTPKKQNKKKPLTNNPQTKPRKDSLQLASDSVNRVSTCHWELPVNGKMMFNFELFGSWRLTWQILIILESMYGSDSVTYFSVVFQDGACTGGKENRAVLGPDVSRPVAMQLSLHWEHGDCLSLVVSRLSSAVVLHWCSSPWMFLLLRNGLWLLCSPSLAASLAPLASQCHFSFFHNRSR